MAMQGCRPVNTLEQLLPFALFLQLQTRCRGLKLAGMGEVYLGLLHARPTSLKLSRSSLRTSSSCWHDKKSLRAYKEERYCQVSHYTTTKSSNHLRSVYTIAKMQFRTFLASGVMLCLTQAAPTPEPAEQGTAVLVTMTAYADSNYGGPSVGLTVNTQSQCCLSLLSSGSCILLIILQMD
jgi:hypothetical protein